MFQNVQLIVAVSTVFLERLQFLYHTLWITTLVVIGRCEGAFIALCNLQELWRNLWSTFTVPVTL